MKDFKSLVDIIIDDDDDKLNEHLIFESRMDELLLKVNGQETAVKYLLTFEEFLSNHDIYMFDGWENAQIVGPPIIHQFWCEFSLLVSAKTDLRGAKRLVVNKNEQNEIKVLELENGNRLLKFKILKTILDNIEKNNNEKILQLAKEDENTL